MTVIHSKVQSEGERDKIIQSTLNNIKTVNQSENRDSENQQSQEKDSEPHQSTKSTSTVRFLSSDDPQPDPDLEPQESNNQQYSCGQHARHKKGHYKAMNEGLVVAITPFVDKIPGNDKAFEEDVQEDTDYPDNNYDLPPDITLAGYCNTNPKTFDEAIRGPNVKEWEKALAYEISQLEKLETWAVEDLPPGQTVIPCSEVVRVKCSPDGQVQSYRVRIVAGGPRQVEGVNYTETFSAAAKMPTIRIVLANTAYQNWEIEHIDVKSTYLNAPLEEVIYMKLLRGVLKPGQEGKILRLLKGLYGLKQARCGWYLEMSRVFLKKMEFKKSAIDHSVFYH
jgi:Reverse transcriptase (RNA-dependent DNA polymerase)